MPREDEEEFRQFAEEIKDDFAAGSSIETELADLFRQLPQAGRTHLNPVAPQTRRRHRSPGPLGP